MPLVVSSDRELVQRCQALGASTMRSNVFNKHLDAVLDLESSVDSSSSSSSDSA